MRRSVLAVAIILGPPLAAALGAWIGPWLVDADAFVPRGCCGDWGAWLPAAYQLSNWLIAASYFAIPAMLGYWLFRRRDLMPTPALSGCFMAFILSCGVGHALDALSFRWPAYRLMTAVDAVTAAASVGTAVFMAPVVHLLMRVPSREQYQWTVGRLEREAQARQQLQEILQRRNDELRQRCDDLREEFDAIKFRQVTEAEYARLREMLHRVRNA